MSKRIYSLPDRGLAYMLSTGEPVFIRNHYTSTETGEERVGVIRPVVTQNGINYVEETFSVDELESPHAQVKRKLAFDEFVQKLQSKQQAKHLSLTRAQKQTLQAQAPRVNG